MCIFHFFVIVEASSFVPKKNPFITKNSGEMSVAVPCMTYWQINYLRTISNHGLCI